MKDLMKMFGWKSHKSYEVNFPEGVTTEKFCPHCGKLVIRKKGPIKTVGMKGIRSFPYCSDCGEVEIEDFDVPNNPFPEVSVVVSDGGWATCPCCGSRFKPAYRYSYSNGKHVKCGQRLTILTEQDES